MNNIVRLSVSVSLQVSHTYIAFPEPLCFLVGLRELALEHNLNKISQLIWGIVSDVSTKYFLF